jgi:DNA-directed RNA polymerase subunit E'/Rpb7
VGEVIDVAVGEVLHSAVIASAGPVKIIIDQKNFGDDDNFVLRYINSVRMFASASHDLFIAPGTELRVRIIGCRKTTVDSRETFMCIGSMNENYLGVFQS